MKTYSFKIYHVDNDLERNLKSVCEAMSTESSPVSVDICLDSTDVPFKYAVVSVSNISDFYYLGRLVRMCEELE